MSSVNKEYIVECVREDGSCSIRSMSGYLFSTVVKGLETKGNTGLRRARFTNTTESNMNDLKFNLIKEVIR